MKNFIFFESEEFPKKHTLSKSILLPFSSLHWVWLFHSSSLSFILILSPSFFHFYYLSHSLLYLFCSTLSFLLILLHTLFFLILLHTSSDYRYLIFLYFYTDTVEMTSYRTDKEKEKEKIASSAQRQKRRVGGMSSGAMGTLRCVLPFYPSLSLFCSVFCCSYTVFFLSSFASSVFSSVRFLFLSLTSIFFLSLPLSRCNSNICTFFNTDIHF